MVELPERKMTLGVVGASAVPNCCVEETPLPPRTLSVPPLNTSTALVLLRRLATLAAVLSRVRVPPLLRMKAGLPAVVVETLPSAVFADAVRPDVLIDMTGWGALARVPWNVTWKSWLL